MDDPLQPDACAEIFAALSAPERIRIIRFLKDGEKNVSQIADMLKTAPVNVSHHVAVMKFAGLIQSRKDGRFMMYSLRPGLTVAMPQGSGLMRLETAACAVELRVEAPAMSMRDTKPVIEIPPSLARN
jgi:DNA-binding transcriptional ArsR family regulator